MIRRRFWVVLLCVVVATAAAAALTLKAEERFESTSGLLLQEGAEPQRSAETTLQLLSLPTVAQQASESLDGVSAEELEGSISSAQKGESDIIEISANAASPRLAAEMANAYAEAFVVYSRQDRSELTSGKVSVVERAIPKSTPVSPQKAKDIGFGAIIGLVLGLGLALLLEQMDRRLKREDDLAETIGLPLLASVPKLKAFDREHIGRTPLSPAETEVFRLLRANLRYFRVQRPVDSLVVTSAEPGEGKTLISLGLALAAATSGEKVLLLEGDLRKPGLSQILPGTGGGLCELLIDDGPIDLAGAATTIQASQLSDAIEQTSFDFLGAGAIPPNPTQLIESARMKELLELAEGAYDFVIIDTPPVLVVSDAMPLIAASNGVLAVSGLGVATRTSAVNLVDQLERMGAPTLGLVVNFANRPERAYQGYGYGRPPDIELMKGSGGDAKGSS